MKEGKGSLGMVPEGWKQLTLADLGEWKGGGTPSKSKQQFWLDGTIPWVSPKDMKSPLISKSEDYITPRAVDESSTKLIPKDSILIVTRSGILRHSVPVALNVVPVAINQDLKALVPSGKFDTRFIANYLWLNGNDILFSCAKDGTTVESIDTDALKKFPILIPPLEQQRKIADILSTWDEAIETLEKLIKAKEKRKRALMQGLLTGKKRFKEFVRSSKWQRTRYGLLPSDWAYPQIGDVSEQFSTKNAEGHSLPVLSCTKYQGLVDSLEYFGKQIFSEDTSTYKIVQRGMFAYATNHIEEGSIGYQNLYDVALISPMYTVFKTDSHRIDDKFLYAVLKTEKYRQIFQINTNASVDRRGSLRWNEFAMLHIPLPSIEEQQKIASVLSSADAEISTLQRGLELYKRQKRGLMQELLTGKTRVKVDEGAP